MTSTAATPLLGAADERQGEQQASLKQSLTRNPIAWAVFIGVVLLVAAIFLYALVYSVTGSASRLPLVSSSCVSVEGYWDDNASNFAAFRGIPYAQAPVGNLRWQPAQPRACNRESIQAKQDGPVCIQSAPAPVQSEDCLFLNVWTRNLFADPSKTGFPVLVWLYGGGNYVGSASSFAEVYKWAVNGDVCMVSINYRLNIFGYLALQELSETDMRGVSGNYGITDVIAALQWIQTNIKAFGCDPTRVTVWGQSSGATNVYALLASPPAKGLFHRAIAMSGSGNITMDLATAEQQNVEAIGLCNCTGGNVASCLRAVPAGNLSSCMPQSWYTQDFWPVDPTGLHQAGLVIVDGVTVNTSFLEAIQIPIIDVPLVLTSMRDEMSLWPYRYYSVTDYNVSAYNDFLQRNFQPWNDTTGVILADFYAPVTNLSVNQSYFDLDADLGVFCANIELATAAAGSFHSPVYVGTVWQPPKTPVVAYAAGYAPLVYPFHGWDYMVSTNAWKLFTTMPGYTSGQVYSPQSEDSTLGSLLQRQMYGIVVNGVAPDMATINSASGFPASYSFNVIGNETFSSSIDVTVNFRQDVCNLLKDLGLNPDSRFWWVN